MSLEKLGNPPLVEVVCGFAFTSLPLDPLLVGTYWYERKGDFPKRDVQPPVTDGPQIFRGVGPIRAWLISSSEAFLVQIQPDRFYLNWRRRNEEYPRFSDHPGKRAGLLSLALDEFSRFQQFCETAIGMKPEATSIDLAKIDHLIEGRHWSGIADLGELVPWLKTFADFCGSENPSVAVRLVERRSRGVLKVSLDTAQLEEPDRPPVRILKVESRLSNIEVVGISDDFKWANEQLNNVFASLIPPERRLERFRE